MWRIFRKMLGALMLFVFFAFLFAVAAADVGIWGAIGIFGLTIGIVLFILLAAVLLDS